MRFTTRPALYLFLGVTLLAVALGIALQPGQEAPSPQTALDSEADGPSSDRGASARVDEMAGTVTSRVGAQRRPELVRERLSTAPRQIFSVRVPPEDSMVEIRSGLFGDIKILTSANFRDITDGQRDDPEFALLAYGYFDYCSRGPLTAEQFDRRLAAHEEMILQHPEIAPDIGLMSESEARRFAVCSGLDPTLDLPAEAFGWLTRAAELGHMGAQLIYYEVGKILLSQDVHGLAPLGLRAPERVVEFRANSARYLSNLLASDHPAGLGIAAQMLADGVVFDRDLNEAAAYAFAAELAGAPLLDQAQSRMLEWLSADEVAAARARGQRLHEQWKLSR